MQSWVSASAIGTEKGQYSCACVQSDDKELFVSIIRFRQACLSCVTGTVGLLLGQTRAIALMLS